MSKSNYNWLKRYEARRHGDSGNGPFSGEGWQSSKYNFAGMSPDELRDLYIPELKMKFGPAVSALRKLWKSYRISHSTGEMCSDTCWKINNVQRALGLEVSVFSELAGMQMDTDDGANQSNEDEYFGTLTETNEWTDLDKKTSQGRDRS
jgi:hypothetical protein